MQTLRKTLLENCKRILKEQTPQNPNSVEKQPETNVEDNICKSQQQPITEGFEIKEVVNQETNRNFSEHTVEGDKEEKKDKEKVDLNDLLVEENLDFFAQKIISQTINSTLSQSESDLPVIIQELNSSKSNSKTANKNNPIVLDDDQPLRRPPPHRPQNAITPQDDLLEVPTLLLSKPAKPKEIENIDSDSNQTQTIKKIDIRALINKLELDVPGVIKEWSITENVQYLQTKPAQVLQKPVKEKEKVFFKIKKPTLLTVQKPPLILKGGNQGKKMYFPTKDAEIVPNHRKEVQSVEEPSEDNLKSNKFAKKGSKEEKKTTKIQSNFGSLIDNKPEEPSKAIDLMLKSLKYLVQQCHERHLLDDELYNWFGKNYSTQKVNRFIQKFEEQKVNANMFGQTKISIMDHRRMTELLLKFYPKEYTRSIIANPRSRIEVFMKNLYELEEENYSKLCQTIDAESKVLWWKQLEQNTKKSNIKNREQKERKIFQLKPILNEKGIQRKSVPQMAPKKRSLGKIYKKNYELSSSELSSENHQMDVPRKKLIR